MFPLFAKTGDLPILISSSITAPFHYFDVGSRDGVSLLWLRGLYYYDDDIAYKTIEVKQAIQGINFKTSVRHFNDQIFILIMKFNSKSFDIRVIYIYI